MEDHGLNRHSEVEESPEVTASYAFCQELASQQAGNFYWSFRLLPREKRRSMCALYAFMRQSDDIADAPLPIEVRSQQLNDWQKALDHCLNKTESSHSESWPGFPALTDTVKKHGIPVRYLTAVLDGMRQDLGAVRIQTTEEFQSYCWHVASTVGLCCLHIWGFDSDQGRAEKLAEQLGLAFQRTNILRDVAEDYAHDRVYLPSEWLQKHGIGLQQLGLPTATQELRNLIREQVELARADYQATPELLALVDTSCRPMLRAISRIYARILDRIEMRDYDVLVERARVSTPGKIWMMVQSVFG